VWAERGIVSVKPVAVYYSIASSFRNKASSLPEEKPLCWTPCPTHFQVNHLPCGPFSNNINRKPNDSSRSQFKAVQFDRLQHAQSSADCTQTHRTVFSSVASCHRPLFSRLRATGFSLKRRDSEDAVLCYVRGVWTKTFVATASVCLVLVSLSTTNLL